MNLKEKDLIELNKLINSSKRIGILLAKNIDPDAYGAGMSLYFLLEKLNKNVDIYYHEDLADIYLNFEYSEKIKLTTEINNETDVIISIDSGDVNLLSYFYENNNNLRVLKNSKLINIDHHNGNKLFGDLNIVDENSASTTEMIYDIINYLNKNLDLDLNLFNKDIVDQILFGILFDTNTFRNSNTTSRTFKIAGECLRLGADNANLINILCKQIPSKNIKLWGDVIKDIKLSNNTAGVIITQELLNKYNIDDSNILSSRLSNDILSSTKEASVTYLITELSNGLINISTRSKNIKYNVQEFCKKLGGGGHILASGARVSASEYSCLDLQKLIQNHFD